MFYLLNNLFILLLDTYDLKQLFNGMYMTSELNVFVLIIICASIMHCTSFFRQIPFGYAECKHIKQVPAIFYRINETLLVSIFAHR